MVNIYATSASTNAIILASKYVSLNEKRSKVGIAGSPVFCSDSPLYGAIAFVRRFDRASGLTRKANPPTGTGG